MNLAKTLLILIIVSHVIMAAIIPETNRITWTPGIEGGIPTITTSIVNVVEDYSADSSGLTDSKTAIQNAIKSLSSSGGVVFLPKGNYKINGSLSITKDNIVIRGEGIDKSKLFFYDPTLTACIEVLTYGRGDWQGVSSYTKDTKVVTVENGSKFTVGEFAEIQQENNEDFMYTSDEWNQSYAQDLVGQIFEIEAINGNQLTFKTALHITYESQFNPTIRPQRLVKNAGVENMYIAMVSDSDTDIISFKNAAYGWVNNIESYYTAKAHVSSESTIGCEVRNSKFSKSHNYGGGGHGYGVSLGYHTTDWLVEDNAFDSLRHAMIFSKGANGNVFGYNYSQNVLQGEGETDLNNGWNPPDVSNHGHYAYMNLIEGNSVQEVGISDYWGPSGPGNVYFRNRVLSSETTDGISYYDHSVKQNLIGNSTLKIRDADGNAEDNLEHGNVINGTVVWDDAVTDKDLPDSYYLISKPTFFTIYSWPMYGPIEGFTDKLPAQVRFEEGDGSTEVLHSEIVHEDFLTVYPNPFNPVTTINFSTSSKNSSVTIYDLKGRVLQSYTFKKNGKHSINFNGSSFASGIYFVKAKSNLTFKTKKIILIK